MAKAKNTKATPKATPKAKTGPSKAEVLAARDTKIVAAYKGGMDAKDVGVKFGLSGVRIYRILGAKGVTLRPRPKAAPKAKAATKKKVTKKATKKAAPRKATKAAKPKGKASAGAPSLGIPKSQSARKGNKPTPSDS